MRGDPDVPYTIADDVYCAGLIWAVLGEEDPVLEEDLLKLLNGPSYPLASLWTDADCAQWQRQLLPTEFELHATHVIGSLRGIRMVWR